MSGFGSFRLTVISVNESASFWFISASSVKNNERFKVMWNCKHVRYKYNSLKFL